MHSDNDPVSSGEDSLEQSGRELFILNKTVWNLQIEKKLQFLYNRIPRDSWEIHKNRHNALAAVLWLQIGCVYDEWTDSGVRHVHLAYRKVHQNVVILEVTKCREDTCQDRACN